MVSEIPDVNNYFEEVIGVDISVEFLTTRQKDDKMYAAHVIFIIFMTFSSFIERISKFFWTF